MKTFDSLPENVQLCVLNSTEYADFHIAIDEIARDYDIPREKLIAAFEELGKEDRRFVWRAILAFLVVFVGMPVLFMVSCK